MKVELKKYSFVKNLEIMTFHEILKEMKRRSVSIVFLNPHSLAVAERDRDASKAFMAARWRFIDGVGLMLVLRLKYLTTSIKRTTGLMFFKEFSSFLNQEDKQYSIYFLGSREIDLEKITQRYEADYPNLSIVGSFSPPFKKNFSKSDINNFHNKIQLTGADVVWVGLTAPKQEKVITQLSRMDNYRVYAGIGAVFDYYSGHIAPPPLLVSKVGLEWAYRLLKQPRHIIRRLIISGPLFVWSLFKK